jgi:alcohol dehydrogenase class IV
MSDFFKMSEILKFQMPKRFVFGNGAIKDIGDEARMVFGKNKKIMVVTDKGVVNAGLIDDAVKSLENAGYNTVIFDEVTPEPPVSIVLKGIDIARSEKVDLIFGIGGGSPIDSAKAISVMVPYEGEIHDYLGEYRVRKPGLPMMFVPTTAGTGAELSNTFVLTDDVKTQEKLSSQSLYTYADLALVDPELTKNLPQRITAESGLDAFSHALECFVGLRSNPLSELFSFRGIELIAQNLRKAYNNGPDDPEARYAMCLGVCMGTLGVRSSATGNVHATCYPMARKYHLSHGRAIALMMPAVMEFNLIGNPAKYAAVAGALGEETAGLSPAEAAGKSVEAVKRLISDLNLPTRLRDMGVKEADFPGLAKSVVTNYPRLTSNNPRQMTESDVIDIYQAAY